LAAKATCNRKKSSGGEKGRKSKRKKNWEEAEPTSWSKRSTADQARGRQGNAGSVKKTRGCKSRSKGVSKTRGRDKTKEDEKTGNAIQVGDKPFPR